MAGEFVNVSSVIMQRNITKNVLLFTKNTEMLRLSFAGFANTSYPHKKETT